MRLNEFVEPVSKFQLNEDDMEKINNQAQSDNWIEFNDMDKMASWLKSIVESKGEQK